MDTTTRLRYLRAMGVEVWLPRGPHFCEPVLSAEEPIGRQIETGVNKTRVGEEQFIRSVNIAPVEDEWRKLQQDVAECRACGLCESRTQTVFGCGNKLADWMLIGEAPGFNEDQEGKPFVGRAGLLLTEMLRAMGLEREQVFIANILKCRPPDNRDPKTEEIAACGGFLRQQIALIQPKIILAVGRIAAQSLLKTDTPLGKLRGRVHRLHNIPLVVIYHPAYLLRSQLEKRKAWGDLQMAMRTYREMG